MNFKAKINKYFKNALQGASQQSIFDNDRIVKKALLTEVVSRENPRNLWGIYLNEFSDLNPSYINYIIEASRKGLDFWTSLLFENIRRKDLHIGGVLQIRKAAIAKRRWDISYAESSKLSKFKQQEILSYVFDSLNNANFSRFLMDSVEANISGYSFFELNWKAIGGKTALSSINYIPGHNVLYDDIAQQYYFISKDKMDAFVLNTHASVGLSQDRIDVQSLAMPVISPYKIVRVFGLDGTSNNAFLNGCRIALIWAYFFKNYGVKDFASFIEQHGIPPILASYDPLMNDQEKNSLWRAIQNWGHIFKMMYPNTAKIEFLSETNKQSTANIFTDYIKGFWDEAISIRVIGNVLTHSAGSSTGSYAQAKVQDLVRDDIAYYDMLVVEPGANELVRKLIDLNFGEQEEYPAFYWVDDANLEYQKLRSEILLNIKNIGYKPTKEVLEHEFEIELDDISSDVQQKNEFARKFTSSSQSNDIDFYINEIFNEIKR